MGTEQICKVEEPSFKNIIQKQVYRLVSPVAFQVYRIFGPQPNNVAKMKNWPCSELCLKDFYYYGHTLNAQPNGYGIMVAKNVILQGFFRNMQTQGVARIINSQGFCYYGVTKKGVMHGEGEMRYLGGAVVRGNWENGILHGSGVESYPDGAIFKGIFVMGSKQGHGQFTWALGKKFSGLFLRNGINSEGTMVWPNGTIYIGNFVDSWLHGKGKLTWIDGSHYQGELTQNRRGRNGKMLWQDAAIFQGFWQEDAMLQGILYLQ